MGDHALKTGDTILLDFGVGQTRATIMWTLGNMAGLKFDDTMSDLAMLNIRNVKEAA